MTLASKAKIGLLEACSVYDFIAIFSKVYRCFQCFSSENSLIIIATTMVDIRILEISKNYNTERSRSTEIEKIHTETTQKSDDSSAIIDKNTNRKFPKQELKHFKLFRHWETMTRQLDKLKRTLYFWQDWRTLNFFAH